MQHFVTSKTMGTQLKQNQMIKKKKNKGTYDKLILRIKHTNFVPKYKTTTKIKKQKSMLFATTKYSNS